MSDTYEHTKNLGELLVTLSSDCIRLQCEKRNLQYAIINVANILRSGMVGPALTELETLEKESNSEK